MASPPGVLHADLDAFYASVEQLLQPALRGRPVAVGGSDRGGVVLAASYEARAYGVHGGMSGSRARRLCPDLVFTGGHFREYQRLADEVMRILGDVTPDVERVSIDEAFLDVTGAVRLFGPPAAIGALVRRRVRDELGLPISVGAAGTKHLAKVASQVAKPDGLLVVEPGTEQEFLDPLPVGLLWGVGPVTRRRLAESGIRTIGDLARVSPASVARLLGRAAGTKLSALAHDEDPRRVRSAGLERSVGAQSALGASNPTPDLVRDVLGHLADRVGSRLRAAGWTGRTVTVRVRFPPMRSVTRALTLRAPVAATLTLTEIAEQLAWEVIRAERADRISLLAISVSNLSAVRPVQLELVLPPDDPRRPGSRSGAARAALDGAVDRARDRFGRDAVGYLPAQLRRAAAVPDEFRVLAERTLSS
ncbi:MAG: DNA polymerase IV [Nocardioides sp.]